MMREEKNDRNLSFVYVVEWKYPCIGDLLCELAS